MVMEHFSIVKEENMLENGIKIACMDKEYFITLITKLLTKEDGKKISFQGKESFIMNK